MLQKEKGQLGEDLAWEFLGRRGFELIARNWRCHHVGEIDLIVVRGRDLVFVEVKTRAGKSFGAGIESLDDDKVAKLFATAEEFLIVNPRYSEHNWQLDLIEVNLDFFDRRARIVRYQDIA